MPKQAYAIALCRVSSVEQLENNSLTRQQEAVIKAAKELEVIIPSDGWWSGSMSSKKGTNLKRPDLIEMLDYCKRNKLVKYLIVDRPDRFMRSINEAQYFEVEFSKLDVKVWYASDKDLNGDDLMAKLLKFTKYFSAEGSNDDRVDQSIGGATAALLEGRYPFAPKPGYMGGRERGIPEVHPVRGPALQKVLQAIASKKVSPSQGLKELNGSEYMSDGHSHYKMDKFRKIVTDPFYAGIVEVNKQVKVRNENGLHERLVSLDQHHELVRIMDLKQKNQSGPRKNGNPDFPLSNLVSCKECVGSTIGRFVGFRHSNGKNKANIYERYRCRSCGKYLKKKELHNSIQDLFDTNSITEEGVSNITTALKSVWKQKEGESQKDCIRIRHKIKSIQESVRNCVEAATEPSNASIKEDILSSIKLKKNDITVLEEQLERIESIAESDETEFLDFAFDFINKMGSNFFDTSVVSPENRKRCKQLLFPSGFWVDENKNVYTPEISPLYRLATKEKDTEVSDNSLLVRVRRL